MRRWEDWERSRLRKLKREERRRKDFERLHPNGYLASDADMLRADIRSQYDGSDTLSLASSDEDQWGAQIGGYNEHNSQFPPPPVGLVLPEDNTLHSAKTLDGAELEAMLEHGFDDRPPLIPSYTPRYQLSDSSTELSNVGGNGYAPLSQSTSPGARTSQPLPPSSPLSPTNEWPTTAGPGRGPPRRGTDGQYGPLGPLDPTTRF